MAKHNFDEEIAAQELKSKINAAGLINAALENLWGQCYYAMANGNYLKWNTSLDSIWVILGGDVKEDSTEQKKINALNYSIYDSGLNTYSKKEGFEKTLNPNLTKTYHLLIKKSLFLRRLQNKQGKGTAYESEDEDDFD